MNSEIFDDLDGKGAVFLEPGSPHDQMGRGRDVCNPKRVLVELVPFSDWKGDGMSDGKCMGDVHCAQVDGGLEFVGVGKVITN